MRKALKHVCLSGKRVLRQVVGSAARSGGRPRLRQTLSFDLGRVVAC